MKHASTLNPQKYFTKLMDANPNHTHAHYTWHMCIL